MYFRFRADDVIFFAQWTYGASRSDTVPACTLTTQFNKAIVASRFRPRRATHDVALVDL